MAKKRTCRLEFTLTREDREKLERAVKKYREKTGRPLSRSLVVSGIIEGWLEEQATEEELDSIPQEG